MQTYEVVELSVISHDPGDDQTPLQFSTGETTVEESFERSGLEREIEVLLHTLAVSVEVERQNKSAFKSRLRRAAAITLQDFSV